MKHIDLYRAGSPFSGDNKWTFSARQFEGQEAIDYAENGPGSIKGLPYFNGYNLQTALHDDGECEAHRPPDPTWGPAISVDTQLVVPDTTPPADQRGYRPKS